MKKILSLIICLLVIVSLTGCKKETNNQSVYELKDSNGNVKIVFENEINKDIELETKTSGNYIKLSEEIDKYVLYNISLLKTNGTEKEKIIPDEGTVYIKIPDNFNKDKLAVYNVSNYVIMNDTEFEVEGKYVKFKTNQLGSYAIAELK